MVRVDQAENRRIRIITNSWLAKMAAWKLGVPQVALTLGSTIHLHQTKVAHFLSDKAWVKHEMKHVEQFRRFGFFRFLALYAWESMRRGYYLNRFEVEAREAEKETDAATWSKN